MDLVPELPAPSLRPTAVRVPRAASASPSKALSSYSNSGHVLSAAAHPQGQEVVAVVGQPPPIIALP